MTGKMSKQIKQTMMLDFAPLKEFRDLPSPRILNTHLPPHVLPKEVQKKKTKLVFIYRNPKDVAISLFYCYSKLITLIDANVGNFDSFKKIFLEFNRKYGIKYISIYKYTQKYTRKTITIKYFIL